MTEKRFTSQRTDDYNFSDILDNGKWIGICHVDCEDDFVNKFNELAEENEVCKEAYNEIKSDAIHLKEENEQLQERNDRQAKQLDRLYRLIEEKDWRTLTDIMDDFKKAEEQLQREWGTYGDWE